MAKKRNTVKELQWRLVMQSAQDLIALRSAHENLKTCDKGRYMASGVIIEIKNLSGESIVAPVCIADGLSAETIEALRADVAASHARRVELNKLK